VGIDIDVGLRYDELITSAAWLNADLGTGLEQG